MKGGVCEHIERWRKSPEMGIVLLQIFLFIITLRFLGLEGMAFSGGGFVHIYGTWKNLGGLDLM